MIGAWGRMELSGGGLRLDEIWAFIVLYGGSAILVSLFTPIPTWLKLRAIGIWLLVTWLISVGEYLFGPTYPYVNCAGPASIILLP